MKPTRFLLLAALVFFGWHAVSFAQTPATDATALTLSPDTQNVILSVLTKLMASHPWVATLLAFMGTMRAWAKPVSSLVHSIVDLTPSKTDDSLLNSVTSFFTDTPLGRFLAYLLDWLTSIKIQPPAAKPPVVG